MRRTWVLFIVAAWVGSGCSSTRVQTDMAEGVDLAGYSTFGFYDIQDEDTDPIYFSELNQERLKNAIRDKLTALGYEASDAPELKIAQYLKVQDRQRVISTPTYYGGPAYWGYYHGYDFGGYDVRTVDYKQGTLIIDLVADNLNFPVAKIDILLIQRFYIF